MRSKIGFSLGIFLLVISSTAFGMTLNEPCAKTPLAAALSGLRSCSEVEVIALMELILITLSGVLVGYSVRERKVDGHGE